MTQFYCYKVIPLVRLNIKGNISRVAEIFDENDNNHDDGGKF